MLTKCKLRLSITLLAFLPAWALAAQSVALRLVTPSGTHALSTEWVSTPAELAHGLMHRESLAPYDGMMFDFGSERPVQMWMKNTRIPLDMVFFDADGRVVHVHERAVPYSLAVIASPRPARYVLELPAGKAAHYTITTQSHVQNLP